jgi:hypothetical protein
MEVGITAYDIDVMMLFRYFDRSSSMLVPYP